MNNELKQIWGLCDLSQVIVSVNDTKDVCQKIADKTASMLNVSKVSIMKIDPKDKVLKIVAAKGLSKEIVENARIKVGEGISGRVFKSARPMLIRDIRNSGFKPRKRYATTSLMSAPVTTFPMRFGRLPIGVINVTDKKNKKVFTPDDLKLLTAIANQTAAYLHLCNLAEEKRLTEELHREIELARNIQRGFLPQRVPTIAGFDVGGVCLTPSRVGGDYFDYLTGGLIPPSVVVADIAGHSVGSAIMMSTFRSAVRAYAPTAMFSPALIAERLNMLMYDDLKAADQFISMVYLQILSGTKKWSRSVKYTTAGHYPPLILQDGDFINHSTEDVLIGVEHYPEFHEKMIEIGKGDVITLYTDGLVEAANARGKRFGIDKLKVLVKNNRGLSAKKLADLICGEVQRFAGRRPISDDVTVVVLKAVE